MQRGRAFTAIYTAIVQKASRRQSKIQFSAGGRQSVETATKWCEGRRYGGLVIRLAFVGVKSNTIIWNFLVDANFCKLFVSSLGGMRRISNVIGFLWHRQLSYENTTKISHPTMEKTWAYNRHKQNFIIEVFFTEIIYLLFCASEYSTFFNALPYPY